ncbi:GWxTD domain-containing protein [Adhaeribacter radiodurans]|uniref:GWxTD domain-containing protein n=1 Tax=Adhaeribacter radiodurans TaxID=2745197 RepID=A0A7L7L5S9_9BACT|nr:GWxTD domain-containing protein [Adhaeribacter radiodurans]QMU27739.1 GWxTD domain-containing protein [Adhaeribacter radiodurans]
MLCILSWFCLGISACSPELATRQSGLNYQFGPDTGLNYDLQTEGDSVHIFLKITDKVTIGNLQKPGRALPYFLSRDYSRTTIYLRDSVQAVNKKITELPDKSAIVTFAIPISKVNFPSVLIIRVPQLSAIQEEQFLDIPLTNAFVRKTFTLKDSTGQLPLFHPFVNNRHPFYIASTNPDTAVTVRQFPLSFTPAIPPMSRKMAAPSPTLKVQSKQTFTTNQPITLPESGIYLLENGGNQRSLLVEEGSFPALTSAAELIEPLIYLTSSVERKNLYDSDQPKLAVDAFWLSIARQDKNLGKSLIKEYYGRVEKANNYFSAHKAGWLTDRGMIYLVFGSPDFLTRTWDREEWIYQRNFGQSGEVKFIFIKKPNTFTQNYYELVRDAAYEFIWYNQVDQWRKGNIGIPTPDPGLSGRRNRRR